MAKFDINCILNGLDLRDLGEDFGEISKSILESVNENLLALGDDISEADFKIKSELELGKSADKIRLEAKKSAYNKLLSEQKTNEIVQIMSNKSFKSLRGFTREFKGMLNGVVEGSFATSADANERLGFGMYKRSLHDEGDANTLKNLLRFHEKATDSETSDFLKAVRIFADTNDETKIQGLLKNESDLNLAKQVAKGYKKTSKFQRGQLVDNGVVLGDIENYIEKISLDGFRAKAEGLDKWKADTLKNVDLKRLLGDNVSSNPALVNKALNKLYKDLITPSTAGGRGGFSTRDLFFNSPEDKASYLAKYSQNRSALDIMSSESNSFGGNMAMATWTGNNPKKAFEDALKELSPLMSDLSITKSDQAFKNLLTTISETTDAYTGGANRVTSDMVVAAQTVKMLQYFNLGSVAKTSTIADFAQRFWVNIYKNGGMLGRSVGDLKNQAKSTGVVLSTVTNADKKALIEEATGFTMSISKLQSASDRYGDLGELNPNTTIAKAHNKVRNGVSKFMNWTGVDYFTKMQQQASVMDATPSFIRMLSDDLEGSNLNNFNDLNFSTSERKAWDNIRANYKKGDFINPELKEAIGVDIFQADQIASLDKSLFAVNEKTATRIQNNMIQKIKSKINAEATTSVTDMNKADVSGTSRGSNQYLNVVNTLLTTFKPTIIRQTADNMHLLSKMLDNYGVKGIAKQATMYSAGAGISALVIEAMFSQLFDDESIAERIFNNPAVGLSDLVDKASPLPAVSDVATSGVRANYRQGFGGMSNNILGPVFQNMDEFGRAFRSKDKAANTLGAAFKMSGLQGIGSTFWAAKMLNRNVLKGEIKYDRKDKDFWKKRPHGSFLRKKLEEL